MTAPGVHLETGAKYAFSVQRKKEDFTPVLLVKMATSNLS